MFVVKTIVMCTAPDLATSINDMGTFKPEVFPVLWLTFSLTFVSPQIFLHASCPLRLSLMFVLDALLPVTSSCNLPNLHRLSHPAKVWYLTLWIHHIHHQFMLYKSCTLIYSTTPWIQLRYCCYPSVHFAFPPQQSTVSCNNSSSPRHMVKKRSR